MKHEVLSAAVSVDRIKCRETDATDADDKSNRQRALVGVQVVAQEQQKSKSREGEGPSVSEGGRWYVA